MKNKVILFCFLCLQAAVGSAWITYVNASATGGLRNGTSWANAIPSLDSALRYGIATDTVWVANGVYKQLGPGGGFRLSDSVKLFGGFSGTETSISQRNWKTFQTVLHANTTVGSVAYSPCVVWFGFNYAPNIATIPLDCRLDGFKVTGAGIAPNFAGYSAAPVTVATGLVPTGSLLAASYGIKAVIANCLITGNSGNAGGGISISFGGVGEVVVDNCTFENNSATRAGGGIYRANTDFGMNQMTDSSTVSHCKLTITDCVFKNNTAPYGGAIAAWDSNVVINRCSFIGNEATVYGGAIYDTLSAQLSVYNSLMVGNKARRGAAHYSAPDDSGFYRPHHFIHCTIATNVNTDNSGPNYAVTLRGRQDTVLNCIFWDNLYSSSGAAVLTPLGARMHNNLSQGAGALGATSTMRFNPVFTAPGTRASVPFAASTS